MLKKGVLTETKTIWGKRAVNLESSKKGPWGDGDTKVGKQWSL